MELFQYLPCPKELQTDGWCRFCNGYLCGLRPCVVCYDEEKKETVDRPYEVSINVMLYGYKLFHTDKKPLEFMVILDHIAAIIKSVCENVNDYGNPLNSTELGLDQDDSSYVRSFFLFAVLFQFENT